jgi:hypothetical protein
MIFFIKKQTKIIKTNLREYLSSFEGFKGSASELRVVKGITPRLSPYY